MKYSSHYLLEIVKDGSKLERLYKKENLILAMTQVDIAMNDVDVLSVSLSVKLKEKNGS